MQLGAALDWRVLKRVVLQSPRGELVVQPGASEYAFVLAAAGGCDELRFSDGEACVVRGAALAAVQTAAKLANRARREVEAGKKVARAARVKARVAALAASAFEGEAVSEADESSSVGREEAPTTPVSVEVDPDDAVLEAAMERARVERLEMEEERARAQAASESSAAAEPSEAMGRTEPEESTGETADASFQVQVKTMHGTWVTVDGVTPEMPLALFTYLAAEKSGVPVARLVREGKELDLASTAGAAGLSAGVVVHALGRLRGGTPHTPVEAQRCVLNLIGGQYLERWPEDMRGSVFGAHQFSYSERIGVGRFLFGNVGSAELVYLAMSPRLGNAGNHAHMRSYLHDLASGRYDQTRYYFSVRQADWHYLDGRLNVDRRPPQPLARALNAWEREVMRIWHVEDRWPTLAEQDGFLGTNSHASASSTGACTSTTGTTPGAGSTSSGAASSSGDLFAGISDEAVMGIDGSLFSSATSTANADANRPLDEGTEEAAGSLMLLQGADLSLSAAGVLPAAERRAHYRRLALVAISMVGTLPSVEAFEVAYGGVGQLGLRASDELAQGARVVGYGGPFRATRAPATRSQAGVSLTHSLFTVDRAVAAEHTEHSVIDGEVVSALLADVGVATAEQRQAVLGLAGAVINSSRDDPLGRSANVALSDADAVFQTVEGDDATVATIVLQFD